MAKTLELDIAGSPSGYRPAGKEQLEEALKRAGRAARLLGDEDFRAWRKDCLDGAARHTDQLVNRNLSEAEANKKRGMIIAIGKLFAELEIQAAGLEETRQRLEEHDRESIPVDHRRWWEELRGF